jgi:para-nitrobenzyl esterase
MSETLTVQLAQGAFEGVAQGDVNIFRNLPYATAGRFKPPGPPPAHAGLQSAIARGPVCPQTPSRLAIVMGPEPEAVLAETCQVVSVFAPRQAGPHPVMVWFHGGANLTGGGELPWYDGTRLAQDGQVVVVTVTSRLGALGFLYLPDRGATNLGHLDHLAALQWVHDNISAFGGDPSNLTVFGQSAGGQAVQALLHVAPHLIQRAIIQSSPAEAWVSAAQAERTRDIFVRHAGNDLASPDVATLLEAQAATVREAGALPFGIVFTDLTAAQRTADARHDILIGFTRDDGAPFATLETMMRGQPYEDSEWQARSDAITDQLFGGPALRQAEQYRRQGDAVATYRIDWKPRGSRHGAAHCVELPLLLGDEAAWRAAPMLGAEPWPEVEARGKALRLAWAAFATNGAVPTPSDTISVLSGPR